MKNDFPYLRYKFFLFLCLLCSAGLIGCVTHPGHAGPSAWNVSVAEGKEVPAGELKQWTEEDSRAFKRTGHLEAVHTALAKRDAPDESFFKNDELFSFEFRGASLDQSLRLIAGMGNCNLLLNGAFSDPVDASFDEVHLNSAFRTILDSYDCSCAKRGEMYVVTRGDAGTPVSHIFTLRSATAADLKNNLDAILEPEDTAVISPEGNVIMVSGSSETVRKVGRYLDSVDQPEKQVLIEAKVAEIVLDDLYELGTELRFTNIHMWDTTSQFISSFLPDFLPGSNQANFTITGDRAAVEGALHALKEITKVEILSRPKILTKNDEEAKIQVIEEVPYIESTATTVVNQDGAGSSTVEQVEFKEVGVKLTVTPHIRGDNSVELKILQDVSEQMGTFLTIPVVDRRIIDTKLVVQDGETAVIGGLIKKHEIDHVSGVPFLMDIPLLGHVFKLTRKDCERRELVILISPTVLEVGRKHAAINRGGM